MSLHANQTTDVVDKSMDEFVAKVTQAVEDDKKFIPDSKRKEQECIDLVNRGEELLRKTDFDTACQKFIFSDEWRQGEIFNVILDEWGHICCHGDSKHLLWKNINSIESFSNEPIMRPIKRLTPQGGWVYMRWNNGFRFMYMKKVVIHEVIYYLGAGFFPQDKSYIAEQLVKTAIAYFRTVPQRIAFVRISNPNDVFNLGDVTLYVSDFAGNIVASGLSGSYVGRNMIDLQDVKGNNVIKEKVERLEKQWKPFWDQAHWFGHLQRNYVEPVLDSRDKKKYLFVGSYLPEIDKITAIKMLARAIKYVHKVGPNEAFAEFNNPLSKFNTWQVTLFVYDFNGNVFADGEYPVLAGKNILNRKNEQGKYIARAVIETARKFGYGSEITYQRNSYKRLFFSKIDTPKGEFIVGIGIYDQSKKTSVEATIENGLRFLKSNSVIDALGAFSDTQGMYYLGDIYLFVIASDGTLLLNGEHKNLAWTEAAKSPIGNEETVKKMMNLASSGGGWLKYNFRNGTRLALINPFYIKNKDGKGRQMCILGCGYYL